MSACGGNTGGSGGSESGKTKGNSNASSSGKVKLTAIMLKHPLTQELAKMDWLTKVEE